MPATLPYSYIGPGVSAGGVTLTIPLTATLATEYMGILNIQWDTNTAPAATFTVVDATGAAVNLSGKSLSFTTYRDDGSGLLTGVFQYTTGGGAITIGGGSFNAVTIQFAAGDLSIANAGVMDYLLKNETDNLDLMAGDLTINPVRSVVP